MLNTFIKSFDNPPIQEIFNIFFAPVSWFKTPTVEEPFKRHKIFARYISLLSTTLTIFPTFRFVSHRRAKNKVNVVIIIHYLI